MKKRLMRSSQKRIISGVCAGLGDYFNLSPWIFRVAFILPVLPFVLSFGAGILSIAIYIILAMIIPNGKQIAERDVVEVDYEIVETSEDDPDVVDCSEESGGEN
ncbi:MAG: PspC domain-containing protein [Eubacteriaceae bacterium]